MFHTHTPNQTWLNLHNTLTHNACLCLLHFQPIEIDENELVDDDDDIEVDKNYRNPFRADPDYDEESEEEENNESENDAGESETLNAEESETGEDESENTFDESEITENENETSEGDSETTEDNETSEGDSETTEGDSETTERDSETTERDSETTEGDSETTEGDYETIEGDGEVTDDESELAEEIEEETVEESEDATTEGGELEDEDITNESETNGVDGNQSETADEKDDTEDDEQELEQESRQDEMDEDGEYGEDGGDEMEGGDGEVVEDRKDAEGDDGDSEIEEMESEEESSNNKNVSPKVQEGNVEAPSADAAVHKTSLYKDEEADFFSQLENLYQQVEMVQEQPPGAPPIFFSAQNEVTEDDKPKPSQTVVIEAMQSEGLIHQQVEVGEAAVDLFFLDLSPFSIHSTISEEVPTLFSSLLSSLSFCTNILMDICDFMLSLFRLYYFPIFQEFLFAA